MKKLLIVLVSVLMCLTCVACSSEPNLKTSKSATTAYFKAVQKGDTSILDKVYVGDPEDDDFRLVNNFIKELSESEVLGQYANILNEQILDFDYKVKDVKEDGDKAVATVEVTTEDWETIVSHIVTDFGPKLFVMALDGKSEKEIGKEFSNFLKDERKNTPDVVTEVEVNLIKIDDEWKINLVD